MVQDPVCGMQIDEKEAAGKSDYEDATYYFCSHHCKGAFEREPGKYTEREDTGQEHHHCC